jgi:hypothetical protein
MNAHATRKLRGWTYYQMLYGPSWRAAWRYCLETLQRKIHKAITVNNAKNFLCDSKHHLLCYCCKQARCQVTYFSIMPDTLVSQRNHIYRITHKSRIKVYQLR